MRNFIFIINNFYKVKTVGKTRNIYTMTNSMAETVYFNC
jgi:hypothetical protein